jgi:hypothetical protein
MSDQQRDWDSELSKIDKQLESLSDEQLFPTSKATTPELRTQVLVQRERTSSWPALLRLALATALGVGILFWPYASRCGVGLFAYLGAVLVLMVGGIWSAVWTWRHRTARAHALSLILVLWGIVLAAVEILPRVGYAVAFKPWMCP